SDSGRPCCSSLLCSFEKHRYLMPCGECQRTACSVLAPSQPGNRQRKCLPTGGRLKSREKPPASSVDLATAAHSAASIMALRDLVVPKHCALVSLGVPVSRLKPCSRAFSASGKKPVRASTGSSSS